MQYEFMTKDGKKPDHDVVPTHLSVAGAEYKVVDGVVDAPAKCERELAAHGFAPRKRDRVAVETGGKK